ncbi:ATP-dependent DNA ligase [Bacterioplanes sanyensis]|uniref:DNA ligase n=1 Tax=Bacterioplanes sanyensis TaxID=1249553 RepID=UPI0016768D5F|nr:DNA ligase [Bacterioplanes sanyensis]GGY32675.1 ATP-dependent DNA ligase [Bacterioplanes sanyensis]
MDLMLIVLLTLALCGISSPLWAASKDAPPVMLARLYQPVTALQQYLVSEKLDGVRAYWDGRQLLTRGGHRIHTPHWFTAPLPPQPLDGELWLGRGRFAEVSGLVRRHHPDDEAWQEVRFMLFDMPDVDAGFEQRLWVLKTWVAQARSSWLQVVSHRRVNSDAELQQWLKQVVAEGGEGLMLRRADARYEASRSDAMLKLKIDQDDEARVVGHLPGNGKFSGMLGALLVETDDGRRFRIGTGFSEDERRDPPPLGSRITFEYNGETANGLPRFARFLRVRPPE